MSSVILVLRWSGKLLPFTGTWTHAIGVTDFLTLCLGSFMGCNRVREGPRSKCRNVTLSLARVHVDTSKYEIHSACLVSFAYSQHTVNLWRIFTAFLTSHYLVGSSEHTASSDSISRCCSALSCNDRVEAGRESENIRQAELEKFAQSQGHITSSSGLRSWRKCIFCSVCPSFWIRART